METIEGFEIYLNRRGLKQSSIISYKKHLHLLGGILDSQNAGDIDSFLYALIQKGRKATYINRLIDVLRVWGDYSKNAVLKSIGYFKEEYFEKGILSDSEIEGLLALEKPKNVNENRWNTWTLFFSVLAYSSMRPGEAAHLRVKDLLFAQNVFNIRDGKTGQRYVPMAPNVATALQKHIRHLSAEDHLFPSVRGGDTPGYGSVVNAVDWGYNFNTRVKRLGIKREHLSVYSLRHSMLTRLLEEGVSLPRVMKVGGHKQIQTTLKYSHLSHKDMVEAIKEHPLIRKHTSPKEILKSIASVITNFDLHKDYRFTFTFTETEEGVEFACKIKDKETSR